MNLLVEVEIKDSLPVNGTWKVPSLSAVDLMPVVYLLGRCEKGAGRQAIEWTEESVFRAMKDEDGIKLEFPIDADFDLLRFCMVHVISSMIRAVLDYAWVKEVYARIQRTQEGGLIVPQAQVRGPLKL